MNKLHSIVICILIFSCNDGNLQIETLDFNNVSVQTCDTVDITQSSVLFKINSEEALILNLAANVLKNEEGTITLDMTSSSTSKIIYRIFSDTVTNTYFCSSIPPSTPTVLEEITATSASITITTTATGTVDAPAFEHYIEITSITLETSSNQRITDLTINEFGTIITN